MTAGWQSDKDRLLRSMKIPPMKKLQWLQEMHEFTRRFLPKRQREIWRKLREARRVERPITRLRGRAGE